MKPDNLLSRVTIPTPCPVDWNAMAGDERVRFCGSCSKHVFNLSAMAEDEAESLIRNEAGKLCARLFRRPDGTVVTANCTKSAVARSRRQFSIRAMMAVVAGAAGAFGLARLLAKDEPATGDVMISGVICLPPDVLVGVDETASSEVEEE
jgi:hypothetical protein